MTPDIDVAERLRRQQMCRRCDCASCAREGGGECHDHVCTDGPGCIESRQKLLGQVQGLRYLCRDAAAEIAALRTRKAEAVSALGMASDLTKAARALVEAVTFDDSGSDGRGGNGGLLSRETIRKADELRLALARFENAA